ncbi:DUF3566 domain-containing protein [Candidatus Gracilibacteria bacterium]|jgi:hypothetical protein|nr:DUF3566 domain-containing protein [Candidatus Gracilibacteria bacterium]
MLQSVVSVKPSSVGKLYAVYVGILVFLAGIVLDLVAIFFGNQALVLTLETMNGAQVVNQQVLLNPWQILLVVCLVTVIAMILAFFYGLIAALLFNLSSNVTGGLVLDMRSKEISVAKPESKVVVTKPVAQPVRPIVVQKAAVKKAAPVVVAKPVVAKKTKKVTKKRRKA